MAKIEKVDSKKLIYYKEKDKCKKINGLKINTITFRKNKSKENKSKNKWYDKLKMLIIGNSYKEKTKKNIKAPQYWEKVFRSKIDAFSNM